MAVLTIHHHLDSIKSFINNIETSKNAYYLFVGRPYAWLNSSGQEDDTKVQTANNSIYQNESSIYNDVVFGKELVPSNVEYLTLRHDWQIGTIYDQYDQNDANLYDKAFYVVTDNNEVFKVIDNASGSQSIVKPALTSASSTFSTSDGYIWKYMYTISGSSNTSFMSTNYMPVTPNTQVSAASIGGTIDAIRVTSSGNNYPYTTGSIVSLVDDNVVQIEASASADHDYYTGCSLYLSSGYGAGQVRKIKKYDGLNKTVTLETPLITTGTLGVSNVVSSGSFIPGNYVTQNVDHIDILYKIGFFNVGDTVIQTGTNASGRIITQNANTLNILRSTSNGFSSILPIYNTIQTGTLKSGTVSVTSNTVYVNAIACTSFTTSYNVGDYIRIGSNANNNIRRIVAVNSTVVEVNTAFTSGAISNVHYSMPYASEVSSVTYSYTRGLISNSNLTGIKLTFSDPSVLGLNFFVGEKINMVDVTEVSQGIYGTCSYSNNSSMVLTGVTGGSFNSDFYIKGESSLQFAKISSIDTFPNITLNSPSNNFITGFPITVRAPASTTVLGSADLKTYSAIPNQLTDYIISPTVTIQGDGTNAYAYSTVDVSDSTIGGINKIVIFNSGQNYTSANVIITSNSSIGYGANATPVISPSLGHGYDALAELSARYAGITVNIANGSVEGLKFPLYGKYRRVGIIKNPLFDDVIVDLANFDRVNLIIANTTGGSFANNEVILQSNTNATGIVVAANSTYAELKTIRGIFSANGLYSNGASSNDAILGLTSGVTARISSANVVYFKDTANVDIVSEINSGANGIILQAISNTRIKLTNVSGKFSSNDTLYDSQTNAYANVVSIFTSNGTINSSTNFAMKFDQTIRIPLTSNTLSFQKNEFVTQDITNAFGRVISNNNEFDIVYASANGSFNVGNTLRNSIDTATGYVAFANNTYLRVTATNGSFITGQTIINNLNVTASATMVYKALVLNGVGGPNKFQSGVNNITGNISKATGKSNLANSIKYPDLVKNTGEVIYLENVEPFELSNTSKETIKVVIKF